MPHARGTPDRIVHDDDGGSGSGGNVVITSPIPLPVEGAQPTNDPLTENPVVIGGQRPLGTVIPVQTSDLGHVLISQDSTLDPGSESAPVNIPKTMFGDPLYFPAIGYLYDQPNDEWTRAPGNTTDGAFVKVTNTVPTREQTGLVPEEYDFIDLGYTGSDITSVVYKTGGAGGATVATLALTYAGGNLDTVTRT